MEYHEEIEIPYKSINREREKEQSNKKISEGPEQVVHRK